MKHGHRVLRLPPYHCHFNAIEMVWGIAKRFYDTNITKRPFSKENALLTWQEALDHVTNDMWRKCIIHTEKIIEEWWDREVKIDNGDTDPFVINVTNSDSEDCSD